MRNLSARTATPLNLVLCVMESVMTLSDLGALGEFLGSIGVIGTLIYLAVEIRQNNRIARASAHLELARERRQIYEDANAIFSEEEVFRSGGEMDLRTTVLVERSYAARFRNWETQWHFWRNGLIDQTQLDALGLMYIFHLESVRELWTRFKPSYHPEFVEYVDAKISRLLSDADA